MMIPVLICTRFVEPFTGAGLPTKDNAYKGTYLPEGQSGGRHQRLTKKADLRIVAPVLGCAFFYQGPATRIRKPEIPRKPAFVTAQRYGVPAAGMAAIRLIRQVTERMPGLHQKSSIHC